MRLPVPEEIPPASELGRVHFVGIGGAGLSAIARIMAQQGVPVTGSDDHDTPFLPALRELGVPVHLEYDAAHVGGADTLVVTTAAHEDNPEVVEGRARGLRLLPRSAGLKSVMAGHQVVAVAGTHGKTTTTSMLTMALRAAGADPTYAIGGVLAATGRNADAGAGDLFVAEADESDGAFLVYQPDAALVTNVDADHLDVWGSEAAYHEAFAEFVGTIAPGGSLVVCGDDPGARALLAPARQRDLEALSVGLGPENDWRVIDLDTSGSSSTFALASAESGVAGPRVTVQVPGRHYVLDAAGAIVTGLCLGHRFADLVEGIVAYTGTGRRMERKGESGGVRVYDSYAHHPAEIAGDLQAARTLAGGGRLVVAYQPHLVSRTRLFGKAMGEALGEADEVVVLDVYVAREEPDPEVTGRLVADAVPLPEERVHFVADLGDAPAELVRLARPGDLVLTLGAGSVTDVGPLVLALLEG
ncbi:MAG: UDP-N-acetylmuramate--L-alanine ligase [Nocardioides sp.]|nr:UDP-N-acetylmuramate--L-alanine ligase [Nocardioides sp.]